MIKRFKQSEVDALVKILKNNGVICVPTDTVWGLCAISNSKVAHDKLVSIKGRPDEKPFPVMCANLEQIKSIAYLNEQAEKIIKNLMPGPITIILKKRENLPDFVTNGKDTIAIRMAVSKQVEDIITKLGSSVFMTSANRSGEKECKNYGEIEEAFSSLDGIMEGNVIFGEGSTIVDCTQNDVKILRNGPISMGKIKQILE